MENFIVIPNNEENEKKFDTEEISEDQVTLYMEEAFKECNNAILANEVPVGCIFLHIPSQQIIVRSHNLTNKTKNATTHAEINCINEISQKLVQNEIKEFSDIKIDENKSNSEKLIDIFSNCVLFVSCEPCIMCAYALSLVSKYSNL